MKIVNFVLGGPASGKGTFCNLILNKFKNSIHLSAGSILRDFLKKENSNNKDWNIINEYINKGNIVPAEITTKLLVNKIINDESNMIFIDGFPRNKDNYNIWNLQTKKLDVKINNFIVINCNKSEMISRLNNRKKNQKRSDDNILESRFKVYENETIKLLNQIKNTEKIIYLDGNKDRNDIISEYINIINN